jgi:hypothetical protein
MPDWMVEHVASQAGEAAIQQMADQIMTDDFFLEQFMKDYDVSETGLAGYHDPYDEDWEPKEEDPLEEEPWDEEEDGLTEGWGMDEETFRAENKRMTEELAQRGKPFDTWLLSKSCQSIARSVNDLEKHIVKRPYVGVLLQWLISSPARSLDNSISRIEYQHTKGVPLDCTRFCTKRMECVKTRQQQNALKSDDKTGKCEK